MHWTIAKFTRAGAFAPTFKGLAVNMSHVTHIVRITNNTGGYEKTRLMMASWDYATIEQEFQDVTDDVLGENYQFNWIA